MKKYAAALAIMGMIASASTAAVAASSARPVRASASLPTASGPVVVDTRRTKAVREKDQAVPGVAIGIGVAVLTGVIVVVATSDSDG